MKKNSQLKLSLNSILYAMKIRLFLVCIAIFLTNSTKAQLLKNIGKNLLEKAADKVEDKIVKEIQQNSTMKINNNIYNFSINKDRLYGDQWIVSKNGNWMHDHWLDDELRKHNGYGLHGPTWDIEIFILNDSIMGIGSEIDKKVQVRVFYMKDSVISSRLFNGTDSFISSIKNSNFSDYKSFTKFSNNQMYNFIKDSAKNTVMKKLGTYEYFNSKKLLFIYTSIWYTEYYVPIDKKLGDLLILEMAKEDQDYYQSEKTCENCKVKFKGSIFVNSTNDTEKYCKQENYDNIRWIGNPKIYCTRKCAEEACEAEGNYIKKN